MATIAEAVFRNSELGDLCELPHAGSTLELPLVFDSTARELKAMADRGMLEIVEEHQSILGDEWLIDGLSFRRKR